MYTPCCSINKLLCAQFSPYGSLDHPFLQCGQLYMHCLPSAVHSAAICGAQHGLPLKSLHLMDLSQVPGSISK